MVWARGIFLFIVLTAFFFLSRNWEGQGGLMILGFGGLSILSLVNAPFLFYRKKFFQGLGSLFFNVFWMYLLFRIMYWVGAQMIWFASVVLFAGLIWMAIYDRLKSKVYLLQLSISMVFIIWLGYLPSHYIFYYSQLNNQKIRTESFSRWDKYSWFLYLASKKEEALEANSNALKALDWSRKNNIPLENDALYEEHLQTNRQKIEYHTWKDYDFTYLGR